MRSPNHNTLPNIVGPWIPQSNDPETDQEYCCLLLALLKPWRILSDLIDGCDSWTAALNDFLQQSSSQFAKRFIENARFYHECKDSA
ncbi:hypothetical protein M378DRAFT_83565, partial [Amanita muscaria Koide BX008]